MRKFLCLLLILLMFMSVFSCCTPVYAEDYESYTLEPGKIYRFKKVYDENFAAEFSDYVLYKGYAIGSGYSDKYHYICDNYTNVRNSWLFVYNINNKSVTMNITEGTITEVDVFDSPFSLVMYDGTETEFKITNNTDSYTSYTVYEYNEFDHSYDGSGTPRVIDEDESITFTGMGFLVFSSSRLQYTTFEGVYEISDYIRSDFFWAPPWILRVDLTGTIRVLLDQLSMLLPAALVILSVFLLVSLLIYTIHLFL